MKNNKTDSIKTTKNKKKSITEYLSKYKFAIFYYVLCVISAGACTFLYTISIAYSIECITTTRYKTAVYCLIAVMAFAVLERIITFFSNYFYHKYSNKIMEELNLDLAKQAFKLNSETYNNHNTGEFVQRIVTDPEKIVNSLASIIDYLADVIVAAVMVIYLMTLYLMTLNVWIALVLLVAIVIGSIIEINRTKVFGKNSYKQRKTLDEINSLTTEIVRSEKDVKSLGLESRLTTVSNKNYNRYRKIRYKTNIVDVGFWTIRDIIIKIFSIAMLILGVYLINGALITLATFMIVYTNNDSLINLVRNIGRISTNLVEVKVSSKRMFSLFDENEFSTEWFGDVNLNNIRGEIEFKKVRFSFKEYKLEPIKSTNKNKTKNPNLEKVLVNKNTVLDNLSFKIKPNTTVAFVGKSGSGKSTILNLMSKMYEVDSGEVLIDGININSLNKHTLRNSISLVNQFPYIFDMTIKENLLLAKEDATDDEIKLAIKKASLDEFVSSLPEGLNTKVGESGIKLSGGQKQRLAIARALLRNSSILVFDESTSSLDNFAHDEVKKSIDSLKGESTIVIVAHRLSTIKNVDHIFFLDDGKICDEGSFDKLFKTNKEFKEMFLTENIKK